MNRSEIVAWLNTNGLNEKNGVISYWSLVSLLEKLQIKLNEDNKKGKDAS